MNLKKAIAEFIKDEEGLTMVEYAIAGGLVAAGAVGAFQFLGTEVTTGINNLGTEVQSAHTP